MRKLGPIAQFGRQAAPPWRGQGPSYYSLMSRTIFETTPKSHLQDRSFQIEFKAPVGRLFLRSCSVYFLDSG